MELATEVYTPMMDDRYFLAEMDIVLKQLLKNNITNVEMYFGWSWGDWTSFDTNATNIMSEVETYKSRENEFPGNDVYIVIKEMEVQLLFCHERDIHLSFNGHTKLTLDILRSWNDRNLIHFIRRSGEEIKVKDLGL